MTRSPYDRVARLEDVRRDPTGWEALDLGNLLRAWGFRPESLGVSFGHEQFLWKHEENPKLLLVLPGSGAVAVSSVAFAVGLIDRARQMQ